MEARKARQEHMESQGAARKMESHECATFLEDHAAYMDECLNDTEVAAHEAHAAVCASCARYARVLSQGLALVRELPEVEPSPHFEERLRHRIFHLEDAEHLERSGGRSFVGVAAAAMIALIAFSPLVFRTADSAGFASGGRTAMDVNANAGDASATVDARPAATADTHNAGSALLAAARGSNGRPDWYAQPATTELQQTPVQQIVSYAGSYSPLIVSPPAARGPRAVRLVSATSQ